MSGFQTIENYVDRLLRAKGTALKSHIPEIQTAILAAMDNIVIEIIQKNVLTLQGRCANMSQRIVELEAEKSDLEKEAADNLSLAESLREECAKAQRKAIKAHDMLEKSIQETANVYAANTKLQTEIVELNNKLILCNERIAEFEMPDLFYDANEPENIEEDPICVAKNSRLEKNEVIEVHKISHVARPDLTGIIYVACVATVIGPQGTVFGYEYKQFGTQEEAERAWPDSIVALKAKEDV